MRIADFLAEHHIDYEPLPHAPAFTAQQLAKSLHVSGSQVAKTVLLHAPAGYFIAVLPATYEVDPTALGCPLGGVVRLAMEREISSVFPDCEWGVVPPFGSLYGLATLLDGSLAPDTTLVLEMHSHFHAIRMRCRDFELLEKPRRLSFARLRRNRDQESGARSQRSTNS
jgi:Ala-tRNA(Pro) deacylase